MTTPIVHVDGMSPCRRPVVKPRPPERGGEVATRGIERESDGAPARDAQQAECTAWNGIYMYFLPSSPNPAFASSSGVMKGWNATVALK